MTYNYILIGTITICVLVIAFMIRAQWVHKKRIDLIDSITSFRGMQDFDKIPSFEAMTMRFWVWDFEKLKEVKK